MAIGFLNLLLAIKNQLNKMNTNIQIFTSDIFGEIRTCQVNNQIMFVGKDVAQALGYSNTRDALSKHVDAEDKLESQIATSGQRRAIILINESGLYSLILSSQLPQAKAFKRWVTSEVLPQIRKTGGYIPTKDSEGRLLTEEQIVEQAMGILGRTLATANANNTHCFTATEVARSWGMDVRSFNKVLSRMGVQYRRGGRWLLADELKDRHLSEDRFYLGFSLKGSPKLSTYLTWTSEGVRYLNSRFLNSGNGQHAIQLNVFINN